jgi:hypothetical protein
LKGNFGRGEPVPATPDQIERFITQWVADIPGEQGKEDVRRILRERLTVAKDDTDEFEEAWRRCESNLFMVSQDKFDERHVAVLRATVCDAVSDGTSIGRGVARNWIPKERGELSAQDGERREFGAKLAHALLGEDGKPCVPAKDYDKDTNRLLRKAAAPPPATIKSK